MFGRPALPLPCPYPARQTDKQTNTMFALIYRINIWECEVNIWECEVNIFGG